jgi:quercetin dioxygenase-like cupin family protein
MKVMRRAILLVAVGVTVLALVVGVALATPPNKGATTTLLTRATLGKFEAEGDGIKVQSERHSADLAIAKVVIEPGGSTGWHHHPGVGPAAVKSGAVTFYDEDCEKTVYRAGEGFLESHDDSMLVRNRGNSKAVFYVAFIIPTSTTEEGLRIDDPQPKECNVR